ncbi:MAG: DUF222 domain-containing protein [Acidimicrobiia bacterium]
MFGISEWEAGKHEGALPEGFETMAPGFRLGNLLETVDRSDLNGYEMVVLVQARARQIAHLQSEFYADVLEMAMCPLGDPESAAERLPTIDEQAVDELRAGLTLTRRSAENQLNIAWALDRLPQVRDLLDRGLIDLPRARVLCEETGHLDREEAVRIVDSLLEAAPDLTTGQLGARLRRRCAEADPEAARRRYEDGVAGRRVERSQNPDGTADLLGRQLPVERAAAIFNRINAIAHKLRGQDDRTLDQIRSDILLDLLEARPVGITDRRGGVEIRVKLTTLLGLDENAGEIAGWGPVIADLARRIVERQAGSQWRLIVTDPDTGAPVYSGVTRRRPTASQRRHVQARNPTCVFPGCRAPATSSQMDHTNDYARGGPTAVANLGPLCAHDHLGVKHKAGWQLAQPKPGVFAWTSPRGHRYLVRPPPD